MKRWVYLRDTRSHSLFVDPDAVAGYGVLGLTQRVRDIVGGSGALVETALLRYRGRYVCDGIVVRLAWLGPNYKRHYAEMLAECRARGRFHVNCEL